MDLALHKQHSLNGVQVVSANLKSCGDREVVTGTGRGCYWKFLATTLHAGGSRVTVVRLTTWDRLVVRILLE